MAEKKMNAAQLSILRDFCHASNAYMTEHECSDMDRLEAAIAKTAVSEGVPPLFAEKVVSLSSLNIDPIDFSNPVVKDFINSAAKVMAHEYRWLSGQYQDPMQFAINCALHIRLVAEDEEGEEVQIGSGKKPAVN